MARDRITQLLAELDLANDREGWFAPLAHGLRGVTAAQAAWQAAPGTNTIWQTVNHLAFWKGLVARRMQGAPRSDERIDNDATFGTPGDPADEAGWQSTVAGLQAAHAALREAIAAREDADLDQPLPEDREPLGQTLLGLVGHDAYHGGQILLLRKLQGAWQA